MHAAWFTRPPLSCAAITADQPAAATSEYTHRPPAQPTLSLTGVVDACDTLTPETNARTRQEVMSIERIVQLT